MTYHYKLAAGLTQTVNGKEQSVHMVISTDTDIYSDINGPVERLYSEAEIQKLKQDREKLVEALKHCLAAAEYLFKPDKELRDDLSPQFYFTLTYAGDKELIDKTIKARQALKEIGE